MPDQDPETGPGDRIPEARYPCHLPSCADETTYPPEELFWIPAGIDGQGPGWYCRLCAGESGELSTREDLRDFMARLKDTERIKARLEVGGDHLLSAAGVFGIFMEDRAALDLLIRLYEKLPLEVSQLTRFDLPPAVKLSSAAFCALHGAHLYITSAGERFVRAIAAQPQEPEPNFDLQERNRIPDGGPYRVKSLVDGKLTLSPHWSALPGKPGWLRQTDEDEDIAGGPGIFSRLALASDVERLLNQAAGTEAQSGASEGSEVQQDG